MEQTSPRGSTGNRFLFVGHHPSLDFINTEMMLDGRRVDLLRTVPDLLIWMRGAGLLTPVEAKAASGQWADQLGEDGILRAVRTYRAAVRRMIDRIHATRPVPDATLVATNRWLRHSVGYSQVVRSPEGFVRRYRRQQGGVEHLLGIIAEAVADLLAHADLSRIKRCRNAHCILYFYDSSKNQARRWCCMSLCGNRIKVAAHYRRQKRQR